VVSQQRDPDLFANIATLWPQARRDLHAPAPQHSNSITGTALVVAVLVGESARRSYVPACAVSVTVVTSIGLEAPFLGERAMSLAAIAPTTCGTRTGTACSPHRRQTMSSA